MRKCSKKATGFACPGQHHGGDGRVWFPLLCSHWRVGSVRLSPCELNEGTFVSQSDRGAGSLRRAIVYPYSLQRQHPFSDFIHKSNGKQRLKSKKQIQQGVRFCFFHVTNWDTDRSKNSKSRKYNRPLNDGGPGGHWPFLQRKIQASHFIPLIIRINY